MAKIKEESLRLNIIINGDKARKQIADYEKGLDVLTRAQKRLTETRDRLAAAGKTETQQYREVEIAIKENAAAITDYNRKLENMRKGMPLTSMTLQELRKHAGQTRAALAKAVPGTENFTRLSNELQATKARMMELNRVTDATHKILGIQIKGWGDLWAVIHSGISVLTRIWSGVTRLTDEFMEYDEALTDAMKTTNLSKSEVTALSDEIAKIDTRTAQNELLALLRIGGKLGVEGQENLLGFVRAADKINVALKEDLGGDAEAAIAQIGKMVDIFQLEGQFGLESAMIKVGSAVNSLGMASTANEGYIVDFTRRLAGIAPNASISIDKILGLAATLDKYGQTAEMSSTAIGQTIMAMFKKTETFADIAKMEVQDFADLLNKDVNEAFIRVLEGMRGTDGSLHSIVAAMSEMHLDGQRAVQVLGTLSKNTDELRNQQDLANVSFTEGASLLEEFETKNTSATASLEKQKKAIQEDVVAMGQDLMPVVSEVMDLADLGIGIGAKIIALTVKMRGVILALTVAKLADVAVDKLRNFWSKANRAALVEEVATLEGAKASTIAYSAVKNLLAGNFKAAASAAKLFGTALKTAMGPVGLVVAALGLLRVALDPLISRWKEQRKLQKDLEESNRKMSESYADAAEEIDRNRRNTDDLLSAVRRAKVGSDERAAAIKAINTQYKDYLPALLTEKSSNEDVAKALSSVNEQLENKIRLQAKEQEMSRINAQITDQTKKTVTGFIEVLEKSIGQETTTAMRAEMTQAVLEYKNAISDASLSAAEQQQLRNKLFGTFFELGGNQKWFRGNKLRGLLDGLDTVIDSASRATELLDQMYGTPTAPTSGYSIDGDDGESDPYTGGDDDDKWSLSKDKDFLTARAKLKKDYNSGVIKTEEDLNKQILQLEIDTLQKRLKLDSLSADERAALEDDLQDRLMKQKQAAAKAQEQLDKEIAAMTADSARTSQQIRDDAIAAENKRYADLQVKYAGNATALEAAKKQHELKMSRIEMDFLTARISEADIAYQNKIAALKNEHQEKLALARANGEDLKQLQADQAKDIAKIDMEYADKLQEILDSVLNLEGEIDVSLTGLTPAELEQVRKKLEEIRALRNEMDGTTPKTSKTSKTTSADPTTKKTGTMFGLDSEEWDAMFDKGVDGWTKMSLAADAFGAAAQDAMNIVSMAMDRQAKIEAKNLKQFEKDQDKKRSELEKRLDAGLITEAQYNAEIEAMDAEYATKEEELALKQAKREKALSLTMAIVNTAVGVTKALTSMVPPLNFINAGLVAAMGATEIALIASTPITTGYASGGRMKVKREQDGKIFDARLSPDSRGFISTPTALVGEDGTEYVIPADGVSNPSLAPFLNTIETARQRGTLKDLSYESLYAPTMTGRASGGFVSTSTISTDPDSPDDDPAFIEILTLIREIRDKMDDPTPAIVSMLGPHGFIKAFEKYEKMKKNGQA